MKLINLTESDEFETELPDAEIAQHELEKSVAATHQLTTVAHRMHVYDQAFKDGTIDKAKYDIVKRQLQTKIQDLGKRATIKIGKSKIPTPLTTCELAHYVGRPESYPDLTTTQVALLRQINDGLIAYGLQPMAVLFGGRKSKSYSGINFVALGASGQIAWRKYDPSAGAGQNWVYLPNIGQMKTSDFVGNPKKYLDVAFSK